MRMLVLVLAALSLLGAAGCVVSPLSQGEGEGGGNVPFDMLAGNWSLPCTADSIGSYYREEWQFGDGKFKRTIKRFTSMDCSLMTAEAGSFRGAYVIGVPGFTSSGLYYVNLDLIYEDLTVQYDIFRVSGELLYFGDKSTGSTSTEDQRPDEIDLDVFYERR